MRLSARTAGSLALLLLLAPRPGDAQLPDRLRKAAEDQVGRELEELVRSAVRCVFDDLDCIRSAEEEGQTVVLTDREGEILTDDEGRPITDPSQLPPELRPRPSASSNYDFEPGDRVLFETDFSRENLGDFPRALELLGGNMQIVDFEGVRLLQADEAQSRFAVRLPETLPDQFTIEFDLYDAHGSHGLGLALTEPPNLGWAWNHYYTDHHYIAAGHRQGSGVWRGGSGGGPQSVTKDSQVSEGLAPVRIMVDGAHAKVFVGERRVANIPNADLGRSDRVYFFMEPRPPELMFVGNIRIAAGGRPLYEALEADGRVAVHGILFDTDRATIRPESAPLLEEIGTMLQEHPDLQLLVEGHTDDQGDFDYNMQLSGERAAAVKTYLMENFSIAADRLRTMGLGSTQPVAGNDTPEGRQQNRRVELVRIG